MEIESIEREIQRKRQLGGTMLACGTCIKSRNIQFEVCPISFMKDMFKLVAESDRVLTF